MGCDIHMHVEYRTRINNTTIKWCDGNLYEVNKFYEDEDEPKYIRVCLNNERRSYTLFGLLAGVRNREIKPIAYPRGFPDDASKSITDEYNSWGRDDPHSASWLTLAELMNAARSHPDLLNDLVAELQEYFKRLFPNPSPLITQNELRIVFWFDN